MAFFSSNTKNNNAKLKFVSSVICYDSQIMFTMVKPLYSYILFVLCAF